LKLLGGKRSAPVVRIYRPLSVQWRRCVHTARPRVVKKPWQWGDVARRAMHSGGGRNSEPASVPSVTDGHQGGCGWACFTAVSQPWRPGDACHRARTEVIQLTPARARHHAATAGGFMRRDREPMPVWAPVVLAVWDYRVG